MAGVNGIFVAMLAGMALIFSSAGFEYGGTSRQDTDFPEVSFFSRRGQSSRVSSEEGTWGTACAGLLTNLIHTRGSFVLFARSRQWSFSKDSSFSLPASAS